MAQQTDGTTEHRRDALVERIFESSISMMELHTKHLHWRASWLALV